MVTAQFFEGSMPPRVTSQKKQLLNNLIDGLAHIRPESTWAKVPRDRSSYSHGYRKISYKMMANAIDGLAWWIKEQLGESRTFETLAYFGTWDPRYILLLLAAVKAGYKMIFPSVGYAAAGLNKLLDTTGCATILAASKDMEFAYKLSSPGSRKVHEIPELSTLLDEQYPHYPFDKTFEGSKSEPLVVVHTSGTTGVPKPLVYTHDWAASFIQRNQAFTPEGHISLEYAINGTECCAVTPPNHTSNLFPNLFGAVPNQMIALYPLPDAPLTVGTAMEMIRGNDPQWILAPPHIVAGIASEKKLIEEVSEKVTIIAFGGGPLPEAVGDSLTNHFRLFSMYATSEMGVVHKIVPSGAWDTRLWNSWKPHPKDNIEFRFIGDDNYEAVVIRNSNVDEIQPVFKLFPELQEWSTKDFFKKNANKEGFWTYGGRVDNIIILSNGGTINPSGYEEKITNIPSVKRALMCANGKPHPALLIELAENSSSDNPKVLEYLWRAVDECNHIFPPQATVEKSRIIFISPERPLPISAKGSIQRASALKLYQDDLDRLYS